MRLAIPLGVLASLLGSTLATPINPDLLEDRATFPCGSCVAACSSWIGQCAGPCGPDAPLYKGAACGVSFLYISQVLRAANAFTVLGLSEGDESSSVLFILREQVRDRSAESSKFDVLKLYRLGV